MKKTYTLMLLMTMFFALPSISNSEGINIAKAPVNVPASFSFLSPSKGHFCNVSSVSVCVLTQSHEDCLKLGGQKVNSCKQMIEPSTSAADHSNHNDTCMAKEDSQEPISCYGF